MKTPMTDRQIEAGISKVVEVSKKYDLQGKVFWHDITVVLKSMLEAGKKEPDHMCHFIPCPICEKERDGKENHDQTQMESKNKP